MAQQVLKLKSDVGSKSMRVLELLTPLNGVVAPTAHADFIGQKYIDTAAKAVYIAIAIDSAIAANDWQKQTAVV